MEGFSKGEDWCGVEDRVMLDCGREVILCVIM